MLTKRFAMELGPHGITVNAVAPGFILTDMAKAGRSEQEFEQTLERMRRNAMIGRVGKPEDIANAVAFLAGTEAELHHGASLNGGRRADGLYRASIGFSPLENSGGHLREQDVIPPPEFQPCTTDFSLSLSRR